MRSSGLVVFMFGNRFTVTREPSKNRREALQATNVSIREQKF
jgi:hypothetical protein